MIKTCMICKARNKVPGTFDDNLVTHGLCAGRCAEIYDEWLDSGSGVSLDKFVEDYEGSITLRSSDIIWVPHLPFPEEDD